MLTVPAFLTDDEEPCAACGQPATGTLGTTAYCDCCREDVLEPLRVKYALSGIGVRTGRHRPDHRGNWYELTCPECGATWVGPPGESCYWCERRAATLIDDQRAVALTPPAGTEECERKAWAARLAHHIAAGVITQREADWAWRSWRRRWTTDTTGGTTPG